MSIYKRVFIYCFFAVLVFSLARLMLLVTYFDHFSELSVGQILYAFIYGLRFDLASIVVFLSIPFLIVALPIGWLRNKIWQALWSWLVYLEIVILAIGLAGDTIYFAYVKRHTTQELLTFGSGDLVDVGGMAFGVYLPYLIVFSLGAFVFAFVWHRVTRVPVKRGISKLEYPGYLVYFVLLVFIGRGGFVYQPISIIDAYSVGNGKQGDLVINGIFSASQSMVRAQNTNHTFFDKAELFERLEIREEDLLYPEYPMQQRSETQPNGHNLVFILFESLTPEYLDSYSGNSFGVTPNLDRMANEGVKFLNFYASGQRSVEGIQATLTGIPSIVGVQAINTGIVSNYTRLGELAKKNGYATIFTQTSARGSFRVDSIAKSTGFAAYYGKEDMNPVLDYPDPDAADWGWDYENFMKVADHIESFDKPFLSYIITSTTHTPYPPLPDKFMKYPHEANGENGFLNTMLYTDWCINEFIQRARDKSWFDNTIFIVTADHVFPHSNRFSGVVNTYRIPLIIYAPKILDPQIVTRIGSQVDVMPTIVDLLNFNGEYAAFGSSLFAEKRKPYAIVRGGSVMGIIDESAYLRHSLSNRLEFGPVGITESVTENTYIHLEEKLLATTQMMHLLMDKNRWAK